MSTPVPSFVQKHSGLTVIEKPAFTYVKCNNCGRRAYEHGSVSIGVERCTHIWNYLRPEADRSIPAIEAMYDKMPHCPLTRD
jgi:hypothetical protein